MKSAQKPPKKNTRASRAQRNQRFFLIMSLLVILSMVVGTIAAPMSRLVGVMHPKLASLIYVLRAAEEKQSAK